MTNSDSQCPEEKVQRVTTERKEKSVTQNTPDWKAASAAMDATIPSTTPVAQALLSRLPRPDSGAQVLDLACGTGQPTLILARSRSDLEIIGVDSAPAMIERARQKAAAEELDHVRFDVMNLETVALPDESADVVISQFGLLQHGDPQRSAVEMTRVLRPHGHFSIATWDHMTANRFISVLNEVMARHAPTDLLPDFSGANALAAPGVREDHLRRAGITDVETALFDYTITLPSFDAVTRALQQPATFGRAFMSLTSTRQDGVRDELRDAVGDYADGASYVFPVACRLFWGRR